MQTTEKRAHLSFCRPWNSGKIVGQKPPLQPKHVCGMHKYPAYQMIVNSHSPTVQHMPCHWQQCVGMDIVLITAIWFFNAWNKPSDWKPLNGGCSTNVTNDEI